jgi:hypothetical protein
MMWQPEYRVCPKTGRRYEVEPRHGWYRWIWPVTGFLATVWFLVRVVPKPSRAMYPCQRAAFPIASSFVAYLIGIFTTTAILGKARAHIRQARYVVAGVCLLAAVLAAWTTIGIDGDRAGAGVFVPTDGANNPIGVARGTCPGRVVWVRDPNATDWSPSLNSSTTDYWWDDNHTSQAAVDEMYSKGVRWLTNSTTDEEAWDKLFRSFNQRKGRGDVGYTAGEKIAIKPNHVQQRSLTYADTSQAADLSPQMMVALLKQLVNKAGVPQDCITICDSSRYISNKEFNRCYALFPNVHYMSTNFYTANGDDRTTDSRRPAVTPSDPCITATHYSHVGATGLTIPPSAQPMPFVESTYNVNLAIMKGHSSVGATFCGKNWYGCFCAPPGAGTLPWSDPADTAHVSAYVGNAYTPTMGNYRLQVDLMGNKNLGEKTVLFVLDGLWGFQHHGGSSRPIRFSYPPFNDDYPSSLLMSQDMVAIDSVGLDFIRSQFSDNMGGTYGAISSAVDDYLHEAALADNPPSGTVYGYEPNGVQKRFSSLGVHEHWNNPIEKKYTRNLGTGNGIELVATDPLVCSGRPTGDVNGDCKSDFGDMALLAGNWNVTTELATNGDFASSLSGWTLASGTGTITATLDPDGNPAKSVRIARTVATTSTSGWRFYQAIPVTSGRHYKLMAQWKGNLTPVGATATTPRNTAEVYVGFVNSLPPATWGSSMYYKRYENTTSANNKNIKSDGTWDWEEITASMNSALSDGVFLATGNYMVVAFTITGNTNSGTVSYLVDNVSVRETGSDPAGDLDGDWAVGWFDMMNYANHWLDCGLVDTAACLN